MSRKTGPILAVRDLVYHRAGFRCERCGTADGPFAIHHRRPRGMGGTRRPETNFASALLLLCDACHSTVESRRRYALGLGYLVPSSQDPAETPVDVRGRWVHLTPSGTYRLCPQPDSDDCTDQTACPSCPNGGDAA
jgi:5-methylcytosine-specific restriction protein A